MKNILQFQFHKLFRQKSFYVILLVALALIAVISIPDRILSGAFSVDTAGMDIAKNTLNLCQMTLLLGILTPMFVCADWDQDTLKNIYAKGYGRGMVCFAQFAAMLAAATILFVTAYAFAFVLGTILWGKVGETDGFLRRVALEYLGIITYTAFYFLIAIIVRRTGGSIAMCIVAPIMLALMFTIPELIFKPKDYSFTDFYFPAILVIAQEDDAPAKDNARAVILAGAYTAVFFLLSRFFSRRRQV